MSEDNTEFAIEVETPEVVMAVDVENDEPTEASKAIIAQYKQGYLVNPNVTVSIAAKAKKRYTVLGAVNKPGSYNFPDGENMSILQAIGSAGGYNRLASPKRVTIKREKVKVPIKLDLRKLTESGEAGTIMIQPGDVINIGEAVL